MHCVPVLCELAGRNVYSGTYDRLLSRIRVESFPNLISFSVVYGLSTPQM